MQTIKLLFILTIILVHASFNYRSDKAPVIHYNFVHITDNGDTINRTNERGKQGKWVYKKADGSTTDTTYKDGVPQNN